MELILVRHAQPKRVEGVDDGANPDLSPVGLEQAQRCSEYLASEPIDAIYSSPQTRAVQTAQPLADRLGVTVAVAEGVAEYDRAASEYVPAEEMKAAGDGRWDELLAGDLGADANEFERRVSASFDEIIAAHPGQTVAVFCHGGVINAFTSSVIGFGYRPPGFFYPDYTSIHRVIASRQGTRTLLSLNETSHLRGTGLMVGLFRS